MSLPMPKLTDQLPLAPQDAVPVPAPARRGPAPTKHLDIVWAATRLFARQGVAATTTRDIAAAAGTTERTLFKHFVSKEGLVHAVIDQAVVAHLAPTSLRALRGAIEAHRDDFESWHRALLHARDQAIGTAPELTRLLVGEMLREEHLARSFAEVWLEAAWQPLTGLFEQLQRERRLRDDVPAAMLVRLFLSLNLGFLFGRHVFNTTVKWQVDEEIAAIASVFARGAAPLGH